MQSAQVALAGPFGLFTLAKELSVHGDEQLLAVLPKSPIAADGLNHVQAGLVVAAGDWQVAKKPRQRARLQLQGALQVRNLGGDGQRAPAFPLRRRGLADTRSSAKCVQRQPSSRARLPEDSAKLLFLRCGRQAPYSLVGAVSAGSIAQHAGGRVRLRYASCALLDKSSSMLYDLSDLPHRGKCRHG
jgi:hypothetical protein